MALYPLTVGANVPELPRLTYSPAEVQVDIATSTQPSVAEDTATKTTAVKISNSKTPAMVASSSQYVVAEILKAFPDAPIMVHVANCESELNPLADRANRNVDVGLFQINQVHKTRLAELGLDRRDLHDNIKYARMLYDESGLGPWYMSKHCWLQYL